MHAKGGKKKLFRYEVLNSLNSCRISARRPQEQTFENRCFQPEIFRTTFGSYIEPDETDRLLSPETLTDFKKYDKEGENKVERIGLEDDLIIKGNNLCREFLNMK